jgi:SurA-like N-terminal domain
MPPRIDHAASVRRAAIAGLAAAALAAGCGGSDSVAHVGSATIGKTDLADAVDHFQQEAEAEDRPFPDKGTSGYRTVERQALALLIYRSELLQSAKKLGVGVSESEVESRLAGTSAEAEEGGRFARDTVRAQLAYEHIYTKVTGGVPAAKRGDTISRWLAKMKSEYDVSYEAGFAPAP